MESLQERLKAVRGAMTQSEFATRLRTPLTTLGRYERGANMPDLAFIINVCTIFDVSPELVAVRARCNARAVKGISLLQDVAAASARLVLKELDEERTERRELSVENRQLYAENRKLLQENGRLREELARLRPLFPRSGLRRRFRMARRPEAFSTTRDCAREASDREPSPPRAVEGGGFSVSEGIWGLQSLERAKHSSRRQATE